MQTMTWEKKVVIVVYIFHVSLLENHDFCDAVLRSVIFYKRVLSVKCAENSDLLRSCHVFSLVL